LRYTGDVSERRLQPVRVEKVRDYQSSSSPDVLAVEEPLEIQVVSGDEAHPELATAAITMRTPGHDRELAIGFLLGEGLLRSLDDVREVHTQVPRPGEQVRVVLRPGLVLDFARLQRNFYATSSCGVCGKASLQALELNQFAPIPASDWQIDSEVVCDLPRRLREGQEVFAQTGGLHAAGLFDREGNLLSVREDVGRHNAVDKVTGASFLAGEWPLADFDRILVVSGRASFELMQKALASGIAMLVAVGAPSSLAVETAEHFGITLIGFTKPNGFNIYAGGARVRLAASPSLAIHAETV